MTYLSSSSLYAKLDILLVIMHGFIDEIVLDCLCYTQLKGYPFLN